MKYVDVVNKAKQQKRPKSGKIKFKDCKIWRNGNQINLWTYWHGYQLKDIDEKGVDILLVGQDWGNPDRIPKVRKCLEDIQSGVEGAQYMSDASVTDKRLVKMFKAFGEAIDITKVNPGMRLFFTNYCLGYRAESETGGMTKTIMRQDKELFDDLVRAIKPKIIICLGKITYEVVVNQVAKDYIQTLWEGKPYKAYYHVDGKDIPVYGVAHPGSRGYYNMGCDENRMKKAWDSIAAEYYGNAKK